MKFIILALVSIYALNVTAQIPRELKERIGKTLHDNEEFKKAFVYYLEMSDKLYDDDVSESLESFKPQFIKYNKSKRCMSFLSNIELIGKIERIVTDLDSEHKKNPNYAKVQSLINKDEIFDIIGSSPNSPMIDGYKDCPFQVSQVAINSNQSRLNTESISSSKLPAEDKKHLIFKDNKLMLKALSVLAEDQRRFFTNSKLTTPERDQLFDKIYDDLKCAFYFASADQMLAVITVFSDNLEEFKLDPNYVKDAEASVRKNKSRTMDNLTGDYTKCSFKPDPQELEKFNKLKASDKKIVDERYGLLQRLVAKSHPKVKELVNMYEKQIMDGLQDKEMARGIFIDKFPDYLEQVNQSLAYSMYGMMKDKTCYSKVLEKVKGCAADEKYVLVNDKINLLMSLCVQDSKEELKDTCKFDQ